MEDNNHELMEDNKHEFYVVRTAPNRETKFMETLYTQISKKEDHGIYAFFRPETVKGYVFVEASSLTKVVDAIRSVPNNKGVIKTPLEFSEFDKYFEKDGEAVIVNERDIVEIVAGPFKGDRAKVVRLVSGKDEVVIEPLNAAVPIPITLNLDDIRVIKTKEDSDEEENNYYN